MHQLTTTKNGLIVQQSNHPLLQPKVKDLAKQDLFEVVKASIAKSFANLNNKDISENDRAYLVNELTNNIRKDPRPSSIRLEEIPTAFSNGIRKLYGDYYGLSVISFENFIIGYLESEQRKNLLKSLPQPEVNTEPDNLTKFKRAKENTIKALELKKEGKNMDLYSLPVYTFLDGLKLIDFTNEDKFEFLNQARRVLASEVENDLHLETDIIKKNDVRRSLQRLIDGGENELVIVRAKKLALHSYLESIILEEKYLDQLIDDRKEVFMKGAENG